MNSNFDFDSVKGASQLRLAFGGDWPSFHDAEVISLCLNRKSSSWIKLHTWKTTNTVDVDGSLLRENNMLVTFRLENIRDLELSDFSHQNVVAGLTLKRSEEGVELRLLGCYGLCGTIISENISVQFQPLSADFDE